MTWKRPPATWRQSVRAGSSRDEIFAPRSVGICSAASSRNRAVFTANESRCAFPSSLEQCCSFTVCIWASVNTQGFVWKFFYVLYINESRCAFPSSLEQCCSFTVCIWRCEHARFCVEVFYVLYINESRCAFRRR